MNRSSIKVLIIEALVGIQCAHKATGAEQSTEAENHNCYIAGELSAIIYEYITHRANL